MKILYAIQGTGNGHISMAMEIVPELKKYADVDVLISGNQVELNLPFKTEYRKFGLGFYFGKNGGIDFQRTLKSISFKRLFNEIKSLPIKKYDLVISDFEPVSAWASKIHNIPSIGLSHQFALLDPACPLPKKTRFFDKLILRYYAPTKQKIGFHYKSYSESIQTPVIRAQVRNQRPTVQNHYTVYLPSVSDEKIIDVLSRFPQEKWEVFSKNILTPYQEKNVYISPIENDLFVLSMTHCKGVICNAGFATTSEALFLGKKLLVIPMKNQFEQKANAIALKKMGITVMKKFSLKKVFKIEDWIKSIEVIQLNFPNHTQKIVEKILENQANSNWVLTEDEMFLDLI